MNISAKEILKITLAIMTFLSIWLRFDGLDWGFPLQLHPDEHFVFKKSRKMMVENTFNPQYFNRPNHFSIYASTLGYKIYDLISKKKKYKFLKHLYISRLMTALSSTLIVAVTFFYLYKSSYFLFAILCAYVMGYNSLLIIHGHYATPDINLTFFMLCTLFFSHQYFIKRKFKWILLSIIFIALGFIEKYPGLIAGIIPFTTIVSCHGFSKKTFQLLVACLFSFLISVFIFSPFIFIEFDKVFNALMFESRSTHLGADGLDFLGNFRFYVNLISKQLGIIGIIGIILSVTYIIIGNGKGVDLKKTNSHLILLAIVFCFAFIVTISILGLHWVRWILPVIPIIIIVSCYGLLQTKLVRLTLLPIFLTISLVNGIGHFVNNFHCEDTRLAFKKELRKNNISKILTTSDGYTSFKPKGPGFAVNRNGITHLDPEGYLMVSSRMYQRLLKSKRKLHKNQQEVYRNILSLSPVMQIKNTNSSFEKIDNLEVLGGSIYHIIDERFISPIRILLHQLFSNEECFCGPDQSVYSSKDLKEQFPMYFTDKKFK